MKCFLLCALIFSGYGVANTTVDNLTLDSVFDARYQPPTFVVCTTVINDCYEADTMDEFSLIHLPGNETCPAGYYFILNRKEGVVDGVNTITCDPSLKLSFREEKRLLQVELFGRIIGNVPLD